jgi:hypothetical protein
MWNKHMVQEMEEKIGKVLATTRCRKEIMKEFW